MFQRIRARFLRRCRRTSAPTAGRHFRPEPLEPRVLLSAGQLDPSFSEDGRTLTNLYSFFSGRQIAIQPDGKVVLGADGGFLHRLHADGSVDLGFGNGGHAQVYSTPRDMVVQPDGRILTANQADTRWVLTRLMPDGSADTTFNIAPANFFGVREFPSAIALRPDGKIVVAGTVTLPGPGYGHAFGVAQYLPDGRLDPAFGDNGKAWVRFGHVTEFPLDVAIQPDGKVVLAGDLDHSSVNPHKLGIVRFTAAGQLDTTFGGGTGRVVTEVGPATHFTSVNLRPDGRILVGGTADATGDVALVQYGPSGALDTTFDGDGKLLIPRAAAGHGLSSTLLQGDGKILWANSVDGDVAVYRFNVDGTPDTTYGAGGLARADVAGRFDLLGEMALRPDGRVLVVGRDSQTATDTGGMTFVVQFRADPGPPIADAGGPYAVAEGRHQPLRPRVR